jgi:thiamine-phosphate pyrophosphorylase
VRGVHLNRRNTEYGGTKKLKISKSCHSIHELKMIEGYDYVLLSPVFDSISKEGYRATFSCEELFDASQAGLINEKVIALGGIDVNTLPLLKYCKFGGIAVLGAIWKEEMTSVEDVVLRFQKCKNLCESSLSAFNSFSMQFITHQTERYDCFQSAQLALEGGCKWIQLRMKEASAKEIESMALRIKPLCKKHNAVFIIDDHVEICKKTAACGVHLGKNDMPPAEARKILGNQFIIGGTCNTYEDILAIKDSVDYIGCGPFRFTTTKKNLAPTLGLEGYRNIVWNCRSNGINIPIVAIGGITIDDIPDILNTGINGIALSGAILNAENPKKETERILKTIING